MSLKATPETNKTVSMTGGGGGSMAGGLPIGADGPTPKNDFKKPFLKQKQYFMSPTDAMLSPCTQKLQTSRLLQRRPLGHRAHIRPSLANKENEKKASAMVIEEVTDLSKTHSVIVEEEEDEESTTPVKPPRPSTS